MPGGQILDGQIELLGWGDIAMVSGEVPHSAAQVGINSGDTKIT